MAETTQALMRGLDRTSWAGEHGQGSPLARESHRYSMVGTQEWCLGDVERSRTDVTSWV